MLELYCASQRWTVDVISDLGSGMNHHKKGLKCLLDSILDGQVGRLVLTHKDRLLRFGAELVFAMCQARELEVVIINRDRTAASRTTWQMTYWRSSPCSARLYGGRSHRNRKLIEGVRQAVLEAQC